MSGWRAHSFLSVLVLFFVSGATGLLYELLWMRRLSLVFGATQLAVATVLAAFMLGLAAGAALSGRIADRGVRPLLLYGGLELFIGGYALGFPWWLELATSCYQLLFSQGDPGRFWWFQGFHMLLMIALLLLPAAAMGATFPLLARLVSQRLSWVGRRAGLLYGCNTAGAVLGTALTGMVLLPAVGLRATEVGAAIANIAVGLVALWWSRGSVDLDVGLENDLQLHREQADLLDLSPDPHQEPVERGRLRSVLLVTLALSGACAMVYEVAWTRFLTLILGSSVYAFTLMLSAFLLGTSLGAVAASGQVARPGVRPLRWMVFALIGAALSAWGTHYLFRFMPFWYVDLFALVDGDPLLLLLVHGLLAVAVMVPTTFCLGALFPLALQLLAGDAEQVGVDVSRLYVFNTLGAVAGALLTGFVLIPTVGIKGSLSLAVALSFGLATVLVLGGRMDTAIFRLARWGLPILVVLALFMQPRWDPLLMSAGMYKYVSDLSDYSHEAVRNYAISDYDLLYYAEGIASVVTVARSRGSGNIWLANNGKVDASTQQDLRTQILLAHLPFVLRQGARDALVVGLASGITAGSVALQPELDRIDVLEIEPKVLEASHFFDEFNGRPLEDPRVRAIANDARNHLHRRVDLYDVIINEPSNPWISGVSNLFTRDFMSLGKERLRQGGVFVQWTHSYGMAGDDLKSVVRTFAEVWEHVLVVSTIEDADVIMLGSSEPFELSEDLVRAYLDEPVFAADLARVGLAEPLQLLGFVLMDRVAALAFAGDVPVNTDDNAHLEFSAPLYLHYATQESNARLLQEARSPFFGLVSQAADERDYLLNMAASFESRQRWEEARRCYLEWLARDPRDELFRRLLLELAEKSAVP